MLGATGAELRLYNTEVPADLPGKQIINLGVSRDRAPTPIRRITPPGVLRALPHQSAAVGGQMREQSTPLHAATSTRTSS